MCDSEDPKSPALAELDEDVLMASGWSHFHLGTQRSQNLRSFPAPWLSRLGFLMRTVFFAISFILILIILFQVFQNQGIQKKLNQLSAQLKDDWGENRNRSSPDLRAKEQFETSQFIKQLNKTLDLRAKEQIETSQFIKQLNNTLNLRAKEQAETSQFIKQLNNTLNAFCHSCPCDWTLYKDSCYQFSKDRKPWEVAREACEADGSHLVIISSSEEQKYLKQKATSNYRWWVGLTDKKKEGTWHWVDGTTLQQSFWNEGEPNNIGDEDCCELTSQGWNDAPCSVEDYWICEREASLCSKL
ncbi:CD209 antigen-like protein C isoform X2 [Dromiciops gliroides]|uniref:CD209 antigen-like protein C isoform X2 n=1 Tax=Dromiciops gliroides TaxID=33562 RepID=UPI001CC72A92|nr:CD209 antigen-like protein C isoform X2 [Dromiciops gliroides]